MKLYTTRSAARVLGVKQDTVKHYALRLGIGIQPGGPHTPWLFTAEHVQELQDIRAKKANILGPVAAEFRAVCESDFLRRYRPDVVDGESLLN